ncbi:MAG TPA: alkaline phosphatase family protein [Thermoanaerobaculia bacterium]|nr:alkaline phosphatase family protein [Thermoanaerobaculia bacterium]
MRLRALRDACAGGFAYGALTYGAVLSLLHVVHNRLGSSRDALIVLAFFGLLYGLWSAAFFLAATLAVVPFSSQDALERRGLRTGLFVYNLFFWEVSLLYGLTYDEAPFHPAGVWGMTAVLALLGVVIAAGASVLSWAVWRGLAALASRGWLRRAAAGLALLAVAVHAAAPVYVGSGKRKRIAPPKIALAETGLKVVLVGLDGADWRVLQPMMDKGKLPAFAGMVRNGATADLATIHHSNSAVIWASIYTGDAPARHGVLDFYRIRFPGMASAGVFPLHRTFFKELSDLVAPLGLSDQVPVDRFSLHASPPLWEIADRAGLTIGVADAYFYSFPALRPSRPESWFFSYGLDELAARPSPRLDLFAQPRNLGLFRALRPILERGDFQWQSGVLLRQLATQAQPRFVNLYTHQPDAFQHWYWKWFQPDLFFGAGKRLAENHDRIPGIYRDFDTFLGRLLTQVGSDTVVIVASDHGHSPTIVDRLYSQHWHGPPGILLMQGGPVKQREVLQGANVYDLYPTVLYLLGLPVPKDAEGKVLLEALDPAFVRAHPVRTVPSYRGLGLSPGLPGASRDRTMNEREIEKLRSLGYIL